MIAIEVSADRRAVRVALAVAVALFSSLAVLRFFDFPTQGIDDANITLVYARNLAAGHGLVFTPGYERVEGFTSMLWVLICAGGYLLTDRPEPLLIALSVALAATCVVCLLELVEIVMASSEPRTRWLARVAALGWCTALPAFWAWTTATLMETALFAALVHGFALLLASELADACSSRQARIGLGGLGAALVICRPESLALVPGALLGASLLRTRSGGLGPTARTYGPALAAVALTALLHLGFRLAYFGHPFPNTYYAKVSPDRLYNLSLGLRYVSAWWRFQPLALLLSSGVACGLAAAAWKTIRGPSLPPRAHAAVAVGGVAMLGLLLPLVGGGDAFGSFRFLQPFAPLLIIPWIFAFSQLADAVQGTRSFGPRAALAIAVIAGLAATSAAAAERFRSDNHLRKEFEIADANRKLGSALATVFAKQAPSLGSVMVGGIAYQYPGRVSDLMGLNWTAMGHSPGDRRGPRSHTSFSIEVFWSAPPELVNPRFLDPSPGPCAFVTEFENRVLRDLDRSQRFRHSYRAGWVPFGRRVVGGFFRSDWAASAKPKGLVLLGDAGAHCNVDWTQHPSRREQSERWHPIWD